MQLHKIPQGFLFTLTDQISKIKEAKFLSPFTIQKK